MASFTLMVTHSHKIPPAPSPTNAASLLWRPFSRPYLLRLRPGQAAPDGPNNRWPGVAKWMKEEHIQWKMANLQAVVKGAMRWPQECVRQGWIYAPIVAVGLRDSDWIWWTLRRTARGIFQLSHLAAEFMRSLPYNWLWCFILCVFCLLESLFVRIHCTNLISIVLETRMNHVRTGTSYLVCSLCDRLLQVNLCSYNQ